MQSAEGEVDVETVGDRVSITEGLAVEVVRGNGGRSARVSVTDGSARCSDASPSGEIQFSGHGRGTQGEDGTKPVTMLLMRHLFPATLDARVDAMPQDDPADWKIVAGKAIVLVQVTRAPAGSSLRRQFAQRSRHDEQLSPGEAHEAILGAVRGKGFYEPSVRAQLALALDVSDLSVLAAPSVVGPLISTHRQELAASGFRSIYLVDTHLNSVVCVFDSAS